VCVYIMEMLYNSEVGSGLAGHTGMYLCIKPHYWWGVQPLMCATHGPVGLEAVGPASTAGCWVWSHECTRVSLQRTQWCAIRYSHRAPHATWCHWGPDLMAEL
jgi:hypothetical protein